MGYIIQRITQLKELKIIVEPENMHLLTIIVIGLLKREKKYQALSLFGTNILGTTKTDLNMRVTGSAALDLAYVGAGRLDGFFQNDLKLWDIASGILIVKEAGGKVSDINYSQIENISIKASSNNIHQKMLEKLTNF